MILPYDQNNAHNDVVSKVLEDHSEWFCALVKYIFYPEEESFSDGLAKPTSFAQWVVHANRVEEVLPEIIEKLNALHSDLFKLADIMMHGVRDGGVKPQKPDFESFVTIYEEFMLYLSRVGSDISAEGAGFDSFTGLRHKRMLKGDIQRELDRLTRQGKSFCISLAKIDKFDEVRNVKSQDEVDGYVKLVAGLIKLSVRSFDDAYFMGKDTFALCLKQADLAGGVAALDRLRRELERQSGQEALSMSCFIAEPCSGDDVDELLDNLWGDLKNTKQDRSDTVLKYREMSPLERFVKEGR